MRWTAVAAGALAALVTITGAAAQDAREPAGHDLTLRTSLQRELGDFAPGASRVAATWCGSSSTEDRSPNAVAGNPVHWVYAIPSDGTDRLAEMASVMQTDAEQIDAWWRAQDTTRAPRNDLTQFPCGLQLDITTVRMAQAGSQLAPLSGRFVAVFNSLAAAALRSSFTKYVVYYDGPVSDEDVCGQGASSSSGFGLAIVYYHSCVSVSKAAVGAHELLHTLGAVPSGAPNECLDDSGGHTCDDPNDLMHPSIDDLPLSSKTLDPGRNDYYGHGGSWPDAQDSAWLVQLDNQATLALTVSGPGSVASDVPGVDCAQSCTTTWNTGTRLALTATPGPGAKLVRWGSACSGPAGCTVTVSNGSSVSALFAPASFRLTVAVSGRGAVRSVQPGITCRPRCSGTFPSYSPVTLVATAAKGWRFRSWSGGCRGSKRSCRVPMTATTSARAVFVRA